LNQYCWKPTSKIDYWADDIRKPSCGLPGSAKAAWARFPLRSHQHGKKIRFPGHISFYNLVIPVLSMKMKRFFLPLFPRKMQRPLAFDAEKDKQEAREKITKAKKCVQTAEQRLKDAVELSQGIKLQKPSLKRKKEGERVVKKYLYQAMHEAGLAVRLLEQAVRLYPICKEFVLADSFEARLRVEDAVILLRHRVWAYFGLNAIVDDIEKAL